MKKEFYENPDQALSFINELWGEDQKNKSELGKLWQRCAAFSNGNQALNTFTSPTAVVSGNNFFISPNQDTRSKMYITNEIEPIVRTLISYMTRAKPGVDIFALDKSGEGRGRARLAERILDAKYDLDREAYNSRVAAYYALNFGTVFRKDFWDSTIGADASVPVFDELGNPVVDPMSGEVQIQNQKTGDNAVSILTPLSISFDWSVVEFNRWPWIMESYLMPVEWIHKAYDRNEPGYTGKATNVTEGGDVGTSIRYLEQLKYQTPYTYGNGARTDLKNKALVQECYFEPCEEAPHGRMIIVAGNQVVYDSFNKGQDLGCPYFMPYQDVMWHPYSMFSYSLYVGRSLGKGLVESLIPQQMRLNEINGAILQNANTLAKVDVLAAIGQLKRGVMNGMGGQIYTYQLLPGAPPPQKWPGVPLPAQFFKEKQDIIEQMVREAGTNFVMQGQPPQGVTASSAIEQLLENANSQQSDMMLSWSDFHTSGFTKKLRIIRNFNKLPNDQLINYLRSIDRDALDEEIQSFVGEDLGDGLTLKIESESMIPKSQKFRKDLFMELAKGPFAQFLTEDSPRGETLRAQFLERMGAEGLDTPESADEKKAKWENERMIRGEPVEVWEEDIGPIHLSCHITQAKDPKFLERASDEVKQAYMMHIEQHKMIDAQKAATQQMQMMEQMAQAEGLKQRASLPASEEQAPQPMIQ